MTNYPKPILLLILATTMHCSTAVATERVDIITRQSHHGTIIRHISDKKSMICDQTNNPFFILYTEGAAMVDMFDVDLDTVYDFEIFNDIVYFCGVKSNITGGYGVVGYFPLAGFPSTTIYYLSVPLFRRVKRLEMGIMGGQTHLLAVGDGIHGRAELLDAIYLGAGWDMHFFDADNKEIVFTDLAITDTYVVVTAYQKHNYYVPARIYYFKKPTSNGSFTYSYIPWIEIESRSSHDIIIEACQEDAFVVALAAGVNEVGTTRFLLVAYDSLNFLSKNIITEPYGYARLRDIKYYAPSKSSELLLYVNDEQNRHSVIYTLTSAMEYGTSFATGHLYSSVFINSLDRNRTLHSHFVASANNAESTANIQHILYDFSQWGNCLEYAVNEVKKIDYSEDPQNELFGHVSYEQNPDGVHTSGKQEYLKNICQ